MSSASLSESLPSSLTTPDAEAETLVESYAEALMDELFEDVDLLIAGDASAVATALAPIPSVAVTAEPVPAAETADETTVLAPAAGVLATQPEPVAPPPSPQPRKIGRFSVVAAALMAASAVGATLWVLLGQSAPQSSTPTAAAVATDPAEGEFLQYLQRSLEVINSQPVAGGAEVPPALPPMPPSAVSPEPVSGVGVIERVYIPYQPPVTTAPAPATAPRTAPAPAEAPTQTAAAPNHTLMGLLELGERSAALFDIAGVTQRVAVGERIGDSGWSLVSVANDQATIRRNGEVRSIFIGQRF